MKHIPYKVRLYLGVILVIWSILALVATIIYSNYHAPMWILVMGPIASFLFFIIGIILVPRTNEDGSIVVIEKKNKKIKKYKAPKEKKPFMSEEEWKKEEEEDEEMMYIDDMDD